MSTTGSQTNSSIPGVRKTSNPDAEANRFGRPPDNLPKLYPPPASRTLEASSVQIIDVDLNNRSQRQRFLSMCDPFYEGDANYIAPLHMHFMSFLRPVENPAFKQLEYRALIAMEDGTPKARMIVHIDKAYNAYHSTQTGFFGFFESANNKAVAHALLNEAMRWLQSKDITEVFGPMNLSTNHQCGLLVENFTRPPFVENTYNPPYYEELFQSFGFGKAKDLLIWMIDPKEGMNTPGRQRIQKVANRVRKREGLTVRPVNLKDRQAEIERMYQVYVRSWEHNWGFVPPSREEFTFLMKDLQLIAIPELILFIEFEGEPVAFSATLPNANEKMPKNGRLLPFNWLRLLNIKKTTSGRLVSLGVVPEYRKRGLETILFAETFAEGQRRKWTRSEIGWTLEDNDLVNRAIESMDGTLDRRYRILGMEITPPAPV
ncbi:MAG: N-acetyltransferase [Myxococcales bacterium]|nr:N-acetyltransferase [Myxococcales bacterium]